ncbi:MAG: FadR family transcriptional regulator [Oceanibaculum nanhaiense]|nr:FadR family transcriptional regulator [Oceanibaculum nanhaiense]
MTRLGDAGEGRPQRLGERVHRALRRSILSGELSPGDRLPGEMALCETFQVSRPVVREALELLRRDGLVVSRRGSGSYVAEPPVADAGIPPPLDLDSLRDALAELEFRLVVEADAAYLAAQRRGTEDMEAMEGALTAFTEALDEGRVARHYDHLFHRAIALATGNRHFAVSLDALEQESSAAEHLLRHRQHFHPRDRGRAVLEEHRAILRLIADQDAEGARRAMRNHLERARIRMMGSGG